MVQFMSSSENNNVWQLPEPEAKLFAGEENSMCFQQIADDGPLPKRWKSSSSSSSFQTATQQLKLNNSGPLTPQYQYNPLSEPSPLGLRLRKSPSLLELAQKRLNQCNTDKGDLPAEDFEAEINRDLRARSRTRASASADKLKASHFPALLLRIGQWEYVSKNEGDLVAKCYFSKHKIVWEILDGGLKKKFEINWADIMALKANTAADGLGTLTIVLDKQPLFFKEINPQPRKHTQWRASSDFTDGEASTHRQHLLQCAQGVLEKHYEKLINCDTRLQFLSQQQDIFLEFPYFAPKPSITNQDISGHSILNLPDMYGIANMTLASTLQTCSLTPLESSSLGLIDQDLSKAAHPSSSVMPTDPEGQKDMEQMTIPQLPATISVSDLVNGLSEQQPFRNQPFSDNHVSGQETPKDMLANISQILLSDNHLTAAASDEKTLMSRVNSLCCLIQDYQKDGNDCSTLDPNLISGSGTQEDGTIGQSSKLPQDHRNGQQDRNDSSTLDTNLMHAGNMTEDGTVGLSTMLPEDHPNGQQDGNDNSNPESYPQDENVSGSGMSRKDSFAELVHQLPRIASLPRFLFDISENGEILK
ncbi:uncharacterized protein LOC112501194 [Cynara cardunculus var. scolymus]|uniref:uncharacterized protein LOC112501194 n=1 Tax=Cynara cardunculus var. scolymus TaxID=59895 RepID=UPI000D625209|nr:uncharacterized protein LOC112501194 [Cynara cardunculus var. scolymus]